MKNVITYIIALSFIMIAANDSQAQFNADKSTIGLVVGYGGGGLSGESAIPFYAEFNFFKINEKLQGGVFVSYASTTEEINLFTASGEWTYTNIIAAAQVNYHFSPGAKFDPFVGASLGYNFASASWEWDGNTTLPEPSAEAGDFFYSGQAGFNYWFSNSMAAQVRVGYYPYVSAGIHFTL